MIRDLYDNSIVAYKTGTKQTVSLVLNTIKAAVQKEAVTAELQLHSDQGFQYTSTGYFNLTKEYGITVMTMLWLKISSEFSKQNV
jgi:putative transposase